MSRNKTLLLLHPFFLVCLFLLIANDHWWKYEYANVLTGKISDFAGVFVMAVCLVACCRVSKNFAIIFTALFFCWWKSPLSEWLITTFGLTRVVDYSDLSALSILPAIYWIKPAHYNKLVQKFALPVIAIISWTAMVATSCWPRNFIGLTYPKGHVTVLESWKTKLTADQVLHKLDSLGISWKEDSIVYLPAETHRLKLRTRESQDSIYQMRSLDEIKDTLLYYEKDMGRHYYIPSLVVDRDTITDIRFQIDDEGRKRRLELIEMVLPRDITADYLIKGRVRRKYNSIVKSLMLE